MENYRDILIIELRNQIAAQGSNSYLEVQKTCNKICEERDSLKKKVAALQKEVDQTKNPVTL